MDLADYVLFLLFVIIDKSWTEMYLLTIIWNWTRPSGKPCIEATEFNLLRNMLDAAGEERYQDAGMMIFSSSSLIQSASSVPLLQNACTHSLL